MSAQRRRGTSGSVQAASRWIRNVEKLERAKGFEPSTRTMAKLSYQQNSNQQTGRLPTRALPFLALTAVLALTALLSQMLPLQLTLADHLALLSDFLGASPSSTVPVHFAVAVRILIAARIGTWA
jgi:hypothetical protein